MYRMCKCGREYLKPRRKQCDTCNREAEKRHNDKVTVLRQQGLLPRPHTSHYEQPHYEQIEVVNWSPTPKPVLMTKEEQDAIDDESNRRISAQHRVAMEAFGLKIREGRPLSSDPISLPPEEVERLAAVYQAPRKAEPAVLAYFGEGRE